MPLNLQEIDADSRYTLREVATLLHLSYQTILKLKKDGEIKAIRIGRRFYVTGQSILEFVESGA